MKVTAASARWRPIRTDHLWLVTLVLSATLGVASAQQEQQPQQQQLTSTFRIDDQDPESAVPTSAEAMKAPLQMGYWVMLVTEKADAAEAKGELEAAARYYRALAKGVPDRRSAFARLCRVYEKIGDQARTVAACRAVLGKQGVLIEDAARFVHAVLAKETALAPAEVEELDAVLAHLRAETDKAAAKVEAKEEGAPAEEDLAGQRRIQAQLRCEIGTALQDEKRLEQCTAQLARLAPNDVRTLTFSFALAVLRGDFERAKAIIARGDQARLPTEAIDRMKSRLLLERERQSLAGRVKSLLWQARRDPSGLAFMGIGLLVVGAALLLVKRRPETTR